MKDFLYQFIDSTFFDRWRIKLVMSCQNGCMQHRFFVYLQNTQQLQYFSHQYYSSQEEAFLAAYFLCLRAFLDREKSPILIVDTSLDKILSINLPAFMLLSIDAVGLRTIDITINPKNHEQIYHELQQTGTSQQPILLCDADGKAIACQVHARIDQHCSSWAVFRISTHANNLGISP